MSSRLVTVFGATGSQGLSVLRSLLKDGTFAVRAVTRNADSPKAQALKALGCEVVEANLLRKDTVEKAVAGSEAVVGITNFWDGENFNKQKLQETYPELTPEELDKPEYVQGRYLVEAASKAGVKFFIWSSLPHTTEITTSLHKENPEIKVYSLSHYDQKADVEKLLQASNLRYANLYLGAFMENLWRGSLVKDDQGALTIVAPKFKVDDGSPVEQPMTWVDRDLGPCVLALLKNYQTKANLIHGKTFYAVSFWATYEDLAKQLSKSTGKDIKFTAEGSSGMKEVDDMFEYQAKVGWYRDAEIPDPRLVELGVKFSTLEDFVGDEEVKSKSPRSCECCSYL